MAAQPGSRYGQMEIEMDGDESNPRIVCNAAYIALNSKILHACVELEVGCVANGLSHGSEAAGGM